MNTDKLAIFCLSSTSAQVCFYNTALVFDSDLKAVHCIAFASRSTKAASSFIHQGILPLPLKFNNFHFPDLRDTAEFT